MATWRSTSSTRASTTTRGTRYRWLRDESPVHWDAGERAVGGVAPRGREPHQPPPGALLARPRACDRGSPCRCRSSGWTTPSTPASADLINKGFTPRTVRQLSDHMRELTNEIIDEIAERGECDFVEDFAIHLPLIIIAELMGLDPDQRLRLYRWSDAMMAGDGRVDPDDPVAARGRRGLRRVHEDVRRAHRGPPGFDRDRRHHLASSPTPRTTPGSSSSSDELLMFLTLLVVAGNETTRNALTGGLARVLAVPRPEGQAPGRARAHRHRRRRDRPLRLAGHVLLPHGHRDPRVQGRPARARPEGADALPVGQPRRAGVRRSRRVPHRPRPEPAPRLRDRHPLLPRRQPGPGRDQGGLHRAVRAAARHPGGRRRRARRGGTRRWCSPSQHLRAVFTPERIMAAAAP